MNKNNKKKAKAVIYTRTATVEKNSQQIIKDQEKLCRNYARKNGYCIVKKFTDMGASGLNFDNNPGMNKLLDYLKKNKGNNLTVIVTGIDRLSRNGKQTQKIIKEFGKSGVSVVFANQNISLEIKIPNYMLSLTSLHRRTLMRRISGGKKKNK
ncbi:MAG: Site-specific recombinase, DNA invertase Pin [Parcubacteria group bacterium GW2011_GWF2_38_76]|nr:MAG: Site-specific recombinase, DNA invertase Pin [Parcubacteria group bacterium GW2011_GWF2_38_76]HBM46101.1 hypothetical protein [Patescibacteria group bacterium]